MAPKTPDFTDALWGISQTMLDDTPEPTEARNMQGVAYLKFGALHGVTVEIESALDDSGDVPALVRQGMVMRCMIPRGTDIEALRDSLAGGRLARLIETVLKGHQLELTPDAGTGRLTRSAARAREQMFNALAALPAPLSAPVIVWPLARVTQRGALEAALPH
ncbi:MAG TPA: hypothetical protein VNR89_07880 [Roseomonas sp.]|nr:hypothetical protein [Roseomonas sp.]